MNYWFTADTHFGHDRIRGYCNRPFSSVEEMDETIINNWNEVVKDNDTVFHLGDFCWGNPVNVRRRLNGNIIFIYGNHDKNLRGQERGLFQEFYTLKTFTLEENCPIIMSHYAMRNWDRAHYNSWQLYGHDHGTLPPIGKQWDVGVDTNNFKLYSYDEIKEIMKNQPDNEAYIKIHQKG